MTRTYLVDLAERTAATYVQALIGLVLLNWTDTLDLSVLAVAAWAAIPAALAVVKAGVAKAVGDTESASLAPGVGAAPDTVEPPQSSGVVTDADPPQDDVPQDPGDHSEGPRVDG